MQYTSSGGAKRAASVSVDREKNPTKKKRVLSDEERVFKELLSDRCVETTMLWGQARELVEDDPRFNVITTTGAKKQLFAEWVQQAVKQQINNDRQQKRVARLDDPGVRDFMELLHDKKVEPISMKWKVVQKIIKRDQRYHSLPTEADRKQAFSEWSPNMQKTVAQLRYNLCDEDKQAGIYSSQGPLTENQLDDHDVSSPGLVDWLRKLGDGHDSMLEYLDYFDAEFDGNLHDVVAAANVEANAPDLNPCDRIDSSFWERIPVADELHRLLLAEGIISLSSTSAPAPTNSSAQSEGHHYTEKDWSALSEHDRITMKREGHCRRNTKNRKQKRKNMAMAKEQEGLTGPSRHAAAQQGDDVSSGASSNSESKVSR